MRYKCVDPFVFYTKGIEKYYASDVEVDEGDPILKSHAGSFVPVEGAQWEFTAAAPVVAQKVEEATAEPGKLRSITHVKPDEPEDVAEPVSVRRGPGRPPKGESSGGLKTKDLPGPHRNRE